MGLPFETPGGYEDDNTTPDTGSYIDGPALGEVDGYSHNLSGGHQGAAGDDDFFEDDYDYDPDDVDEPGPGDQAGWDPGTGPTGGPDQM